MRRFLPWFGALALLIAGCGFGWYWFTCGQYIEKTDNAYIRSEITQISAKVAGYVSAVAVEDNTLVAAGDELLRIEDHEFRVRLDSGRRRGDERRAALVVARQKSRLQLTRIEAGRAQLTAAEAELSKRSSELRRFGSIYTSGIVSEMDYENVVTAEKKASSEVASARASLAAAQQEREVFISEERRLEAELRQQDAEVKLPAQELRDTVIRAPLAGVVGNRRVRAGQYVKPGTVLLAVIPRHDLWVEANFKEIQLARMRAEQPVTIAVDAFPGQELTGLVTSLAPASAAEFSLIPPENATGNFTKIVQRVPVKISFDKGQPLLQSLRAGMSVIVRLDTRAGDAGSAVSRLGQH